MTNRFKIILAIVGGMVIVAIYTINQLTGSSGEGGGTTLSDVLKELVDDVGFVVLCVLLILALVFLPVGL